MKATTLKRDRRFEIRNDRAYKVQAYGECNDYPQQVMEIVDASGTGKSCVDVYAKFISGKGFEDVDFYKKIVNRLGQTNDYISDQISKDFAEFGGFALHVNYNANFKICELQHIPFEQVRFEMLDLETFEFNRVALHPDWGRRFTNLRRWRKEDISYIDFFNPDPVEISAQVEAAGGWENYKGQILYFSNEGERVYPLPVSDTVLTDMSTEEGIANVSNRNARNNFLTAGMLINKVADNESAANIESGNSESEDERREENGYDKENQSNQTELALKSFQGDESACKIMYVEIGSDEEKPEFVSFKGTNYDKEFTVTLQTSQSNIGKRFNQPPILRAENVGANFGADLMKNAYDYYNSVVENERLALERVFSTIFHHWFEPTSGNYSITPLRYDATSIDLSTIPVEVLNALTINERRGLVGFSELINSENDKSLLADKIGVGGTQSMVSIVSDPVMTVEQKRGLLKILFALSDEELNAIIPIV